MPLRRACLWSFPTFSLENLTYSFLSFKGAFYWRHEETTLGVHYVTWPRVWVQIWVSDMPKLWNSTLNASVQVPHPHPCHVVSTRVLWRKWSPCNTGCAPLVCGIYWCILNNIFLFKYCALQNAQIRFSTCIPGRGTVTLIVSLWGKHELLPYMWLHASYLVSMILIILLLYIFN